MSSQASQYVILVQTILAGSGTVVLAIMPVELLALEGIGVQGPLLRTKFIINDLDEGQPHRLTLHFGRPTETPQLHA
jgi:hypothetical protein